ncbi:UPF0193 protein EVG1 isoform X4 [Catharus ustulatus]|uniref:UPF0193 protein EVG1 isoform X4 n=1 Tax=Catharus ustulatus TaxID=91951 RepID=UPI00140E6DCD|nr:UPF0193 protein EVG1 isoform X4 [Catharus ustulatus]
MATAAASPPRPPCLARSAPFAMETTGIPGRGGGSAAGRPARYSTGTRELVKAMMEEMQLTHSHKRYLMDYVKRGDALPLQRFPPSSKESVPVSCPAACQPRRLPARPLLRPAKVCRAGDAYTREKFKPQPTRKSANIANKYTVMPRASLPLLSISCLSLSSGSISELLHVFRLCLQRCFRNGSLREHLRCTLSPVIGE